MRESEAHRAIYRVWQFGRALQSYLRDLDPGEWSEVAAILPPAALELYRAMPRQDQRHALRVLAAIRAAGQNDASLLQAALLHDVGKHGHGVTLTYRVLAVLIKKYWSPAWRSLTTRDEPEIPRILYPLWAHAHHPQLGAVVAAKAGLHPAAVRLISLHQDGDGATPAEQALLATLRTADDDN